MSFLNFDHMLKGVFRSPTSEVYLKANRAENECWVPESRADQLGSSSSSGTERWPWARRAASLGLGFTIYNEE